MAPCLRIFCALIIAFCCVTASGQKADLPLGFNALQEAMPTDAFDRGMQEYRASNWKEAAHWMAIAEQQAPGKTQALLIQARSLLNLGEFAQASHALRSYIALHTTSSEAFYALGYSLYKENKPGESLETFTKAATLAPPKAPDFQIIGLDYVLLNDYPDAIKWLEHAVELEPNNVESLYALARCYYTQSRFNDAEKKFRAVLRLQPDNRRAWQNIALVFEALNRPEEADSAFRRSIEIAARDPKTNEWPYLDYGGFLLDHDRPNDAIPVLERAVAIARGCAACHEKLGRSLSLAGRFSEAEHELQQAVALDPQNPKMHFELSRIYRQNGNLAKAREEAALSAKLYGTHTSPETK
jgi:tetratricopeptide (TPR) repeat protein